jgi:integrase/recombinase XerD
MTILSVTERKSSVISLRQRVLDELQRRNYSPATTRGYILAIKQFADYFGKSPEVLGADEIRQFETYLLRDKKLAPGTVEGRMSALRFLYKKTLKRRDITYDDLIFPKTPQKLPVVLSPEEVTRLIEAAPNLMHRTILMVLYATGVRRTEASLLKVTDLDSERMVIHVRQGKGSRDRDVPMTPKLLEALRDYWRWKRPKVYLFPSTEGHRGVEQPISDHTIWSICSEAAKRAGLQKRIGAHTLRHSFATTLMESGTDLRTIQLLLGHSHLEHTTRYLHLSQRHLQAVPNPLDQITIDGQSFSRKRPDSYHE